MYSHPFIHGEAQYMAEAKGQGKLVFGLDIGTRSIVGTVGYREGDIFIILAQESVEHETRAMLDGQIHDIAQVGNTIKRVKRDLEDKLDVKLTDVCIAAAGRVLETIEVHIEWELDKEKEIDSGDIAHLTSMGIEKAYSAFVEKNTSDLHFFCVGNSVVRYYLNGYQIGNLENHKARSIGADMIATFLPDEVVDGLYKAVELAGLRVVNMTLEPIAAISVAIPEMYRMLNIGLVDVGAGTSDICITKDGSIIAYGMIPVAGDSLTETIAKACLVDFNTAEQIKRSIGENDQVEYSDIMGLPQRIDKQTVLDMLSPGIDEMTSLVADKFMELNGGKPVSAVFVVGGGGRIESYTKKLSEHLGIVAERVALRGEEVMGKIRFKEENARKDSLLVTPIGICLNYYEQSNNFIYVSFNEEPIKIYDSGNLAVVDAAMHADFPNDGLFPKRGREINYTINQKKCFKRGSLGEAAVITVNGEEADMHTPIRANDVIVVKASTAGEDAKLTLSELPEFEAELAVIANGNRISLPCIAIVNGEEKNGYYEVADGDDIVISDHYTVAQVLRYMDVHPDKDTLIKVNNQEASDDTPVYENFSISWEQGKARVEEAGGNAETSADDNGGSKALYVHADSYEDLPDDDEEEPVTDATADENEKTDEPAKPKVAYDMTVRVNGKDILLRGKPEYVFVDVFDYIDFDLQKVRGSRLITDIDGRKAEYMEVLRPGADIVIRWEK